MKNLYKIQRAYKFLGYSRLILHLVYQLLNFFMVFKINYVLKFKPKYINSKYLILDLKYYTKFITVHEVIKYCAKGKIQLTHNSIVNRFHRGDRCHGLFLGEELICYGWYSYHPIRMHENWIQQFDQQYVLAQSDFTLPEFRGRQFNGFRKAQALKEHKKNGYKGYYSEIAISNYGSLKSNEKLGAKIIGFILFIKLNKVSFFWGSKNCWENNFFYKKVGV